LKLPTAKIDFMDFLQFEAAFLKITTSRSVTLPIAIGERNISEKKKFESGR